MLSAIIHLPYALFFEREMNDDSQRLTKWSAFVSSLLADRLTDLLDW